MKLHNFDAVIETLTELKDGLDNCPATKAISLLYSLRLEDGAEKWLQYWGHKCVAIFLSQPDIEGAPREYDVEIDPRDCDVFCVINHKLPTTSKPWTHMTGVAHTLQEAITMIQFAARSRETLTTNTATLD